MFKAALMSGWHVHAKSCAEEFNRGLSLPAVPMGAGLPGAGQHATGPRGMAAAVHLSAITDAAYRAYRSGRAARVPG